MTNRCRLAVVASHFIQYQSPLWRELATRPEIDLTVHYLSDFGRADGFDEGFGERFRWDVPLDEGFRWRLLPGAAGTVPGDYRHRTNLSPIRLPFSGAYDAILRSDYDSPGALLFLHACRLKGIPVLFRGESTRLHERPSTAHLKRFILRPVFRNVVRGLAIGSHSREYLHDLGVPTGRLFDSPYGVDSHFWERVARDHAGRREDAKKTVGLPPGLPAVLYCGKLIEKKRPLDLVAAIAEVSRRTPVSLLVAGNGLQREEMERRVAEAGFPACFLGFVNQTRLPDAYAAADILCLPSGGDETWGLVVNEAMYFGCVPVVSDRVGCAPDLVAGVGEVFPAGNVRALAGALELAIFDGSTRREAVLERISRFSIEAAVDGIVEAALDALGG